MNVFVRPIPADRRKQTGLRLLRLLYEGFPVLLVLQDFRRAQLDMPNRILAGPMMGVVIRDTENGKVFVHGVGVVAVDMVEFKAHADRLADAAHAAVLRQQALSLRLGRLAPHLRPRRPSAPAAASNSPRSAPPRPPGPSAPAARP